MYCHSNRLDSCYVVWFVDPRCRLRLSCAVLICENSYSCKWYVTQALFTIPPLVDYSSSVVSSAQLYVLRQWNGMRILVLKIITLFRVWTQVLRKGRQFLLYILRCYCSGHNELTPFRNLHATTMINSQAYRIVTWQPFIGKAPLFDTPGHVVCWTMGIVTSIQCGLGTILIRNML